MEKPELDAIRERMSKATAGPWYAHNTDDDHCMNVFCVTTNETEPDTESQWSDADDAFCREIVALTLYQARRVVDHASQKWEENAEFIAHARTDVPNLLAEVDRLTAALDKAERELRTLRGGLAE